MASGKVEIEETLIGPKIGEGKKGRLKMQMKNTEGHSIIQCTRGHLSSSSARFPCLAIGKEMSEIVCLRNQNILIRIELFS